ncbi:putative ski2-type helicase protein, partial [Marine Group I thaumarchaeote SCGC AAA799-D07]
KHQDIMENIHDNFKHEKLYAYQKLNKDWTKSLLILHHWINDEPTDDMELRFGAQPGDRYNLTRNAGQLAYVVREIARYWKYEVLVDELDILRQRIKHGVSEKYLDLITIKDVGRKRAKILYKYGFHDRVDLRKASLEKLAEIDKIGKTIAKSIKSQVEKVA